MTFLRIVIPLQALAGARSFQKIGSHFSGSCSSGNQINATGLGRSIGYNAANKPASITQGTLTLNFADDVDHQRYKQTIMQGATVTTTRYLDAFGVHVELVTSAARAVVTSCEPIYALVTTTKSAAVRGMLDQSATSEIL